MKKILMIIVIVFLMYGVAVGADKTITYPSNTDVSKVFDDKNKEMISSQWIVPEGKKWNDGYLSVKTRSGNEYRIYPCGKVDKLVWKEINPNEDNEQSSIRFSIGSGSDSDSWQYLIPNTSTIR